MIDEIQIEELLSQMTLKEKVALLAGQDAWNTVPMKHLGISSLTMTDGPHGVRANLNEAGRMTGLTTAFPTGIALASTWDTGLVEQVGQALAEETLAMGCQVLLGPCVNIVRHPLGGRNFESYSEDPYLAGRIGVAWVNGLQSRGAGASLKHFACNNQETERMRGSSEVDERTLREIYLAQFETIVKEAHPWTVMCAYNRLNGIYASEHPRLLTQILKEEWGYDGVVVSDWGAVHNIYEPVAAGLDLEMPGPARYFGDLLREAANNWQIEETHIDEAARRMLRLLARAGMLSGARQAKAGAVNTREHQRLARLVAQESITLLKNANGTLPLQPGQLRSIAVIGPAADAGFVISGGGSARVIPPYRVTPLQALRERLGSQVSIWYEEGCDHFVDLPVVRSEYLTLPAGAVKEDLEQSGALEGLLGEYFDQPNFEGEPALVRTDDLLDFWWWRKGPTDSNQYAVRWTGSLTPPRSGRYTFEIENTCWARLSLGGRLVVEHRPPTRSGITPRAVTADLELEGGRLYDLRLEFVKDVEEGFGRVGLRFAYTPLPEEDDRFELALEAARQAELALVFVGNPEGYETEGRDRPNMDLPGRQDELVRLVATANANTIVIVNTGAPVAMPWEAEVATLVQAHYPGLEGGNALVDVLTGVVNPSGKLTVTYPVRLEDSPAFGNACVPGERRVLYGEGVFVGYRYYDARQVEPLFPFGHGLSYTTFEYRDLQSPAFWQPGEPLHISLGVTNTGPVAGHEVIQLYVADRTASRPRPPKELKAFARVALQPGESQVVNFELDERALAFYDPDKHNWVVEPGEFDLLVGASSRDIRLTAPLVYEGIPPGK